MAISKAAAYQRGRIAGLSRAVRNGERPADDPELNEARQNLAYEQLASHAARVVAGWPQPTDEQVQRIAAILRAGGAAA
jgi:hypothetical protein